MIDIHKKNPFEVIVTAAHRGRSYSDTNPPLIEKSHKKGVTALREIKKALLDIDSYKEVIINSYQKTNISDEESEI
tara:strand:+ start:2426 stop:2653 length:228 start_codon:yes stop_codon:yes gene_type:complete